MMNFISASGKILCVSVLVMSLSGCATLFSGSDQDIRFKAVDANTNEPVPSASCAIEDEKGGTYKVNPVPGNIHIERSQGTLNAFCKRAGYKPSNTDVHEEFNPVSAVNILFAPFFLVDYLTGALLKYPEHVVVRMKR